MHRQRPSNRPALTGSAGFTLVEVVVAMLIACVMMTAVMGVAVSAKRGSSKGMHSMMFDQGIAQISGQLKQYVTACGCNPNGGACPAPACTQILGPNASGGGVASWYLNGGGGIVDAGAAPTPPTCLPGGGRSIWALACGDHFITGVVPTLEGPPYCGYIHYNVTWPGGGCTGPLPPVNVAPVVAFDANWTELTQ